MYFYQFINIKYSMSDFLSPFPQLGTPSNNPIREPMDKKKKKKKKTWEVNLGRGKSC